MTTIAQLSDLHLLEDDYERRPLAARARLSYLSLGRPLAPRERRERAARALLEVSRSGADHLVITGDLTEDGLPAQFEVLAALLADAHIPPERVTLIPGNHDAYDAPGNYAAALAGPLSPYARTSANLDPVVLGGVTLVPISTAFHQIALRSAGAISPSDFGKLRRLADDRAFRGRPLVLVQHHPPGRLSWPPMQWLDGLREHGALSTLAEQTAHLHIVHGHTHQAVDRHLRKAEAPRVFSALAVVEAENALRLYQATPAGLMPLAANPAERMGGMAVLA
jgi:3',5'-cyclic AMP phosphodiesterase CpdA